MARWLKINGTDYNLDVVGALSFTDFKTAGENSFSKGVADDHLKQIHKTLTAAASGKMEEQAPGSKQPAPLAEQKPEHVVNAETLKEQTAEMLNPNEGQLGENLVYKPETETDGKPATNKEKSSVGKGKRTGVGKG